MDKRAFLDELQQKLATLPQEERNAALEYFSEVIDDAMNDEGLNEIQAVEKMEPAGAIAGKILDGKRGTQENSIPQPQITPPGAPQRKILTVAALSVRQLLVRARNIGLRILTGSNDTVTLEYPEDERFQFDYQLENGQLTLLQRENENLFLRALFWMDTVKREPVTLTLPQEFAADIDLGTSNARIECASIHVWGGLRLVTSNARIEIGCVDAKAAEIKTSNGRIQADRLQTQTEISLKTSNGRIQTGELHCTKELRLQTSNGAIDGGHISAQDIFLITSNGKVEALVEGSLNDYSVDSGTSNGKNSLPAHTSGAPRRLSVRTSNGRIDVHFSLDRQ